MDYVVKWTRFWTGWLRPAMWWLPGTAVLLDFALYEKLMAQLEDLTDLVSLGEAVNEPARPYEQFLAELAG